MIHGSFYSPSNLCLFDRVHSPSFRHTEGVVIPFYMSTDTEQETAGVNAISRFSNRGHSAKTHLNYNEVPQADTHSRCLPVLCGRVCATTRPTDERGL